MLDKLSKSDFDAHLNQTFRIDFGDRTVDAELVEVGALGGTVVEGQRAPFSVVFSAPQDALYGQAIFKVEHEKLGSLEIFLVPLGPKGQGMQYEAVFT